MNSQISFSKEYSERMIRLLEKLDLEGIEKAVDVLWHAFLHNKLIFVAGNGGSASTAEHLAADIGKNTTKVLKGNEVKRFRTLALTVNHAWITALGNDESYENIFVEQLRNFASPKDVIILISGSGNSPNLIKTVKWAHQHHMISIGLLGFDGGKLEQMVDIPVLVSYNDYGLVESVHSYIQHYFVEALKRRLLENK